MKIFKKLHIKTILPIAIENGHIQMKIDRNMVIFRQNAFEKGGTPNYLGNRRVRVFTQNKIFR